MSEPALNLVVDTDQNFDWLEKRIEDAERNAYAVRGSALAEIRDKKRWLERYNYGSFEEYCEHRWEMTPQYANQLIRASAFAEYLRNHGFQAPARERHIRPLFRLDNDNDRLAVWRDVVERVDGRIKAQDVEDAVTRFLAAKNKDWITLNEWRLLDEEDRRFILARAGKKGLNRQDNTDIEWADWSWNPVSGCLHGCPYCYARDIAFSIYPAEVGFEPTLWSERLTSPRNQAVPSDAAENVSRRNIFTCSMADLFGRWVPDEWIDRVLQEVRDNPQWNFLFLTKFPRRMSEFVIPTNAWMGTSVDLQARVSNAERAFEKVGAGIRWLSIEPMLEPLRFTRLDLFDWIVIGGASPSKATDGTPATPAWNVPVDWLADLHQQARAANCAIYYKTNSGLTGSTRLREYPGVERTGNQAPAEFNYLKEQAG